jgi:hypothetical protein
MKMIKLKLACCMILLVNEMQAQAPKFSNDFLNIGVGARGMALGTAVTASTDNVNAAYWNPANLVGVGSNFQVGAQHAEWFSGIGKYDYLGFGKKFGDADKSFGAISLIRMGIDNIPNTLRLRGSDGSIDYSRIEEFSVTDYALIGSYGRHIPKAKLDVGVNAKVIFRNFGSFANAFGFGFDLGASYQVSSKFKVSAMARDITTTFNAYKFSFTEEEKAVLYQTNNEVPTSSVEYTLPKLILAGMYKFQFGANYNLVPELDLEISNNGSAASLIGGDKIAMDPRLGLECGLYNKVYLRTGVNNIQRVLKEDNSGDRELSMYPSAGVGIKLKKLSLDYAMTNIANTGVGLYSHYFSLLLNF